MLYSVIYTSVPTIVVAILDKDLSSRTLLKHPQLYGSGHRRECYNSKLFWLTMLDTLWQSVVVFFVPLLAYWGSDVDRSGIGDLWTIAVVILVNLHLAMDVIRWTWITHAAIWGSIVATCICVIVIDAISTLPGYWYSFCLCLASRMHVLISSGLNLTNLVRCRAIFQIAKMSLFWLCLLGILVAALLPRFVVKVIYQHLSPCDVQIAREVEKFGVSRELGVMQIEMNPIVERQWR